MRIVLISFWAGTRARFTAVRWHCRAEGLSDRCTEFFRKENKKLRVQASKVMSSVINVRFGARHCLCAKKQNILHGVKSTYQMELSYEVRKQAFPCTFGWTFSRCIHIGGLCPKHVETRRGHRKVYPRSACSISVLLRWCWKELHLRIQSLHDKHGTAPVGCRGSVDVNCLEASAQLQAGAGCRARQP